MSFVHLHVHSEYSLLEASCRAKSIAKKAAEFGMPAVALTDNGNMFGAIEFYFACLEKNIKPIIGLDLYLAPESRLLKTTDRNEVQRGPSRLVLLATSLKGYQNLCQISTIGYQEGFYYKPRVDLEVLKLFNEDLICLSGGLRGDICGRFLKDGAESALQRIKTLQEIFPERLYLELNRTGISEWQEINKFLLESSKITGVPVVATNDVHYLTREDQISQEVLVCIGTNKTLEDESRFRLGSDQFYFKDSQQMLGLFADVPEACQNTLEIAERIKLKFKLKDELGKPIYYLPSFPTQKENTLKGEIQRIATEGLETRYLEAERRNEAIPLEKRALYTERLNYELSVIDKMGFNGYFLIVADFINWAKLNQIPVGPGRGSGAGSLVAYSLGITDLDPMTYKLLFERFLNPERISMPDFDIDFCQDRRGEVIDYVTQKYGQKSVAQIITYGKLQCRAAIKDVGRVLGMTFAEVDVVTKLVPDKLNITIGEALETEPKLREMMELNPQVATLIDLAQKVEGMVRHAGIHAAGVIIADEELVKHAPLYKGADGENVVQYDMKHAEKIGLIKFDFLGLKTLTLIAHALKIVEKNTGQKIQPSDISLLDPGIYEVMSKGDTAGIFQFEGEGITDAIRKIKPTNFFDITAINALYRPGPMAMIPEFAKRKNGESRPEYLFKELEPILSETYGIIVYQEQVMAIASAIAGYSLGEADMLRRAMGKKIKEEMDQHRIRFLKGAGEKGFEQKKSEELFELMYKFADYGFNKSHAAAYCVVAAQTAWLKHYYPAEFFAATLTTEMSDTDKIVKYVKDAQRRQLKVLPPSVNSSEFYFTVEQGAIYFGLGGIKGVGEAAIGAIVEARQTLPEKKFKNLEEFFNSVDPRKLNKKVLECLIKAGAFDGFGYHRAQLIHGYSKFLERAEGTRRDLALGQVSLFELNVGAETEITIDEVKPWNRHQSLYHEKDVLGFFLSDHPLNGYDELTAIWTTCPIADLGKTLEEHQKALSQSETKQKYDFRNRDGNKKRVIVSGLIQDIREVITKKGTRMAFGKIESLSGTCEIVVFPDTYSKYEQILKHDQPLMIGGFLEGENGAVKIIVDQFLLLEDALVKVKALRILLHKLPQEKFGKLQGVLKDHPGKTKVEMIMHIPEMNSQVTLETETPQEIQMSQRFIEELQENFGRTDFIEVMSI